MRISDWSSDVCSSDLDGHMLPTALAVGIAVPVLLLGVLGYRHDRQEPPYAFFVLFAAIALPCYGLAEFVTKTHGLIFLAATIAAPYLATPALFFRKGGPLNLLVAAIFLPRTVNLLLPPTWDTQATEPIPSPADPMPAPFA